jgi:hypothetical protein
MAIREGPFQNIESVRFPEPDTPEDFIHGEDFEFLTDCSDEDTKQDGGAVTRLPSTGTTSVGCLCTDTNYSGGYDCYSLRFFLDHRNDPWPDCVRGKSSGARIRDYWPSEPAGWGTSSPDSFSTPSGRCWLPNQQSGGRFGNLYRVTITYCSNCAPSVGAPDDCCG